VSGELYRRFMVAVELTSWDSAWKFYGIQRDDIAAIRTNFLLRILVVDSEPFQNLIDGGLNPDLHWERRYPTSTCNRFL
jgi:hypothetical protein